MFTRQRKERILGRHKTRLMYANRTQIKVARFQTMLTRRATLMLPHQPRFVALFGIDWLSPLHSSTK